MTKFTYINENDFRETLSSAIPVFVLHNLNNFLFITEYIHLRRGRLFFSKGAHVVIRGLQR